MVFAGLPVLQQLSDVANFNKTIAVFLPQFWDIERVWYGEQSGWQYFKETNPFVLNLHLLWFWIILCFVLSVVTGNYSWVDRFWSIIPTSYSTLLVVRGYFSGEDKNGLLHARLIMVWFMQILWTARLTRNYYRKGGYERGSQDYRWNYIRSRIGVVASECLNVVFICIIQNLLLFTISVPCTYIVFLIGKEVPLNWRDVLLLEVLIFSYAGQLRSDDMQLRYQNCKARHVHGTATFDDTYREWSIPQLDRGFVTAEFWRVSRHPAFFLEQVIWIAFYLWAAGTSGAYHTYTLIGPIFYVVLFQFSTRLTEYISASKYPAYKRYQQSVGMLLPIPGYIWVEENEAKLEEAQKEKDAKKTA